MDIEAGLRTIGGVPETAVAGLRAALPTLERLGAVATPRRAAHLIGQCAHESLHFTRVSEGLFYSTGARIFAVWPSRFSSPGAAEAFARNPEKLANKVYGGRMGNRSPGDGFRYRGRGYLQLTGRDNYRAFGQMIGVDLEAEPDKAAFPEIAWAIAGCYFANRKRAGKTALEWADLDNVEMVTRIVNGGLIGLEERRFMTAKALRALMAPPGAAPGAPPSLPDLKRGDESEDVRLLQRALAAKGFSPGGLDGDFGGKTEKALTAFQSARGMPQTGRCDAAVWAALQPLPA